MGSWNGTCGLSQMPIQDGDKILLFPLLKDKYAENGGAGFTYSYNQYAPISIPLFGTYNDYGGIENITKNKDFVWELFQQGFLGGERPLLVTNEEEFERQEKINRAFTGTPQALDELLHVYLRNRVYEGAGYMLVLEEVYAKVLDEIETRKNYRSEKEMRAHFTEAAHAFLTKTEEILAIPLETIKVQMQTLTEQDDNDTFFEVYGQFAVHIGNYKELFEYNPFVEHFSNIGKSNYAFKKVLLQKLVKAPKENQEKLVQSYVDLILFDRAMEFMRKLWTPQAGSGSQGREMHLHKLIAQFVIEKEQEQIDEWFEDHFADTQEDIDFGRNCTKEDVW